jgi:uncharacterized protein (DUF169 family)
MSELLEKNRYYAKTFADKLMLGSEPVAVKIVREGEEYPSGFSEPEKQQSHCKAVVDACRGKSSKMTKEMQGCGVGASALGMQETAEKVAGGQFHHELGVLGTDEAAKKMIGERKELEPGVAGEILCPLKDADFEPDAVIFIDIPERLYWLESLITFKTGGRLYYSSSPAQCMCEDVTIIPILDRKLNISLGCFGCRKRTDLKPGEMAAGIPYEAVPEMIEALNTMSEGVMTKAKRD